MAHYRLEHRGEARRWLDKIRASAPSNASGFSWEDVEIGILRREAEALILGSPVTPP